MPEVTHAKDARTVYSNVFGVMFTGADLRLQFGIETNPGVSDGSMEVQTSVMLSHTGAKFLAILLDKLISGFEEATGTVIPIDDARLERLEAAIANVKTARSAEDGTRTAVASRKPARSKSEAANTPSKPLKPAHWPPPR